jgi:hypothetical protein
MTDHVIPYVEEFKPDVIIVDMKMVKAGVKNRSQVGIVVRSIC